MQIVRLLDRKGSLMEAALILPLLIMIVFLTYDIAEKQIVTNAAGKAAREASRIYAQQENIQLAREKAEETFQGSVKMFGTLEHIQIQKTTDTHGSYAVATVQASVRVGPFDFAWKLLGREPIQTVTQTRVYMIEPSSGYRQY
ncbi:hypothetical protein GCM10010965_15000 [Caldalkalibacillus thermarum]|uniref:TadE/TadG family type IV pilus assembly protein n=1 Tax=Caldalkalibacillus thermarum TaxID=296745 RepID=UPI001663E3A6|nr:pilus assembly protein [Caldalkalibacillus thermarum]GGK23161.1 hypothetical protein GCM10010965_15000 [Caldalkalibacillus thermarum]